MDDDGVDLPPQQVFDTAQLRLQQAVFPLGHKRNAIKDAQAVSARARLVCSAAGGARTFAAPVSKRSH